MDPKKKKAKKMKNRNRCGRIHITRIQHLLPILLLSRHQEMADSMSPLPPPNPPPPPSHKSRRIHRHGHHPRHREGFGFTDSDMAAAHQLIQLSDDSDEDKRRSAKGGPSGGVDREVTSAARIEEIFGSERGDDPHLRRPRKKRYRSIAEIYAATRPIESRRTGGHHMIR
ncbi:hypothetical protein BT93_I0214 [Corymbia citriodora subsp. variegata]|nr:hypothetical protein BT93_I0214 [Corymbia citriodora subsp. variegata]